MADEPATKAELQALEMRLIERLDAQDLKQLERMEKIETTLLNEFRKWAVPFGARMRVFEAIGTGLTERVTLLEERMNGLEQK